MRGGGPGPMLPTPQELLPPQPQYQMTRQMYHQMPPHMQAQEPPSMPEMTRYLSGGYYEEALANFNIYDPTQWLPTIQYQVFGIMLWPWLLCTFWCLFWTIFYKLYATESQLAWFEMPVDAHVVMGGALGFLVVMRTDASMERWWEARCSWSTISNCCLSIGAQIAPALNGDASTERVLMTLMAFVVALKAHLRDQKIEPAELGERMDPELIRLLNRSANPPLQALKALSATVRVSLPRDDPNTDNHDESKLGPALYDETSEQIRVINHAVGACMKVKSTPMVFSYIATLRSFLLLWLATFPMALIGEFGWMAPPALSLIAFLFLNVEQMAVEIEQPFGDDANDLPMESYIMELETSLMEMAPDFEFPPDEEDEAQAAMAAATASHVGWNRVSPDWAGRRQR